MPGEAFYKGLTLAEQVQKFLDHHYDPKTRHISSFEAAMLDQARARIEQTLGIAKEEAARELRDVYETLLQVYETVISSQTHAVAVHSFPVWHLSDPIAVLLETGLSEVARDPTPGQVQAILAALMTSTDFPAGFEDQYASLEHDRRLVERALDEGSLAILNRVLYAPTVVAENSWADVAPLLEHLSKAKTSGVPVVVFGGAMVGSGNLLVAFLAGSSVIALQLLQNVAEGMAPGLRALGEKLTASWKAPVRGEPREDRPGPPPSAPTGRV